MFPLRDSTPGVSFPVITVMIIMVNVLVFLVEIMAGSQAMESLVYVFGLVPANINPNTYSIGNYYSFLTSTFLHGSWMHVLGNMWMLWIFGDNVEDHMGKVKFLLFYILCGMAAGMTHYVISPQSNIPVIGASGAVAGVMGAYFMMFRKAKVLTYIPPIFLINIPAWIYLGFWAVSQLYCGTADLFSSNSCGQIAFWAHIGGFAAGMLLYKPLLKNTEQRGYM